MPDDRRPLTAAPDSGAAAAAASDHAVSRAVPLPEVPRLMAGKRGLIMGVANDRSIAWGIAQSVSGQGARLPSERRYAARARSMAHGVDIAAALHRDILALLD